MNEFGRSEIREFVENGSEIHVNDENKSDYVRLLCQEKMTGAIRQQLNAFLEGFYDIIPKSLISIFNEQELELLISGLPNIDVDDLMANTEYNKYTSSSMEVSLVCIRLFLHHQFSCSMLCCRFSGFGELCARSSRKTEHGFSSS